MVDEKEKPCPPQVPDNKITTNEPGPDPKSTCSDDN